MWFNIFLSIFLILQFFYLFLITIGLAAKIISVEKQVQEVDKTVKTQLEIAQIQSNFMEHIIFTAPLVKESEAAVKDTKKKKKES